jgi:hypothetical protein
MTLEHQRTQEYTGSDRKAYVKKFAKLGEFWNGIKSQLKDQYFKV